MSSSTAPASVSPGGVDAPGRPGATPLVVGGAACVVLGGLVAAITDPLSLDQGSWLAAYLVLVCGVGSYVIGMMQRLPLSDMRGEVQLGSWVVGNAAVIIGSLTKVPAIVDVGAVLLVVALVIALLQTRHDSGRPGLWLPLWVYRTLLVVLAVSTPVGAVLAHLRHG